MVVNELNDEIHDLVTEGVEEHHVVDTLIAEIKALSPSDEQWAAKLKVLIENGAPTAADKAHLSTEELNRLAREQQIPGRSSMRRDELMATIAPRS